MHRAYRWNDSIQRIAVVGNHLPRRCGIATFTTDLTDALSAVRTGTECIVVAMNDPGRTYDYPPRVRFHITERAASTYRSAADYLNMSEVGVVSLQHEYGVFGGRAGALLLDFVRDLRMPLVTTLHTIVAEPSDAQRVVLDEVVALSERVIVMSANGKELLTRVHGVDPRRIDVIPHGIHEVPRGQTSKSLLGLDQDDVILTFGLLSRDKGIEYVIDALPAILARRPKATYVVVGVTHPHVKESAGEEYRLMLEARAKRLGVAGSIVFHDRFVEQSELLQFLSAADIYVTPYLNRDQITSGTLAYAVGAGKAVVSTPYRYAVELLDGGRGLLVPMKDAGAIAREVLGVLEDEQKRRGLEERAAAFGRTMKWPVVARAYLMSFEQARLSYEKRRGVAFRAKTLARRSAAAALPEVDLTHVAVLTDDTGILQHAAFNVPRRSEGYCLDDNARALLLTTMLEDHALAAAPVRTVRGFASRYLAFVEHAYDQDRGRFRNFLTYARDWVDAPSSEDCHGRALWALGTVVARSRDDGMKMLARRLWHEALAATTSFTSPRAWAYTILGIDEYLSADPDDNGVRRTMTQLAARLVSLHGDAATVDWPWFEDRLTYCNARLPHALLVAGRRLDDDAMVACATKALRWLCGVQQQREGSPRAFAPIGSNGFWVRGRARASFDQQPVEAGATVSACLEAHRRTRDGAWLGRAQQAFDWFLGANELDRPLYDSRTGGCRDGLHADRLNENQGAESTLSFLLALVEMHAAERVGASVPDVSLGEREAFACVTAEVAR